MVTAFDLCTKNGDNEVNIHSLHALIQMNMGRDDYALFCIFWFRVSKVGIQIVVRKMANTGGILGCMRQ